MMLHMNRRQINGINILDCSGRIVFGDETSALRGMVEKLIAENPKLILNLEGVNYIDSGGLGTLVSIHTSAKKDGASVKLVRLTERVGDLLQLTKLLTVFDVYETEEQAVTALYHSAAA